MRDRPEDDDLADRAATLAWSTARALRAGHLAEARSQCEEALQLNEAAGLTRGAASVRTTLGRVLLALGELTAARDCLEQALAIHDDAAPPRIGALTRRQLADCALNSGDLDGAMELLVQAATVFARLGEGVFEADAQLAIGAVHHAARRLLEAEQHAQVALTAARSARDEHLLGDALLRLGALSHEGGRFQQAQDHLEQAHSAFLGVGARVAAHRARLGMLRLELEHGRIDLARASTLVADLEGVEDPWTRGAAHSALGVAQALSRDTTSAAQTFQVAEALLASHPVRGALVGLDRGWVDLALGDRDRALDRLGVVPEEALISVDVRLALRALRRRLARG